MSLTNNFKAFFYGATFGLVAGASLYQGHKFKRLAKAAFYGDEDDLLIAKSKGMYLLSLIALITSLSGGLFDNFGEMPFDSMVMGEGLGFLIGFYLRLKKDSV